MKTERRPITHYPNTFRGGMSKAADIADLLACSTDDLHRRECQLWVGREIRASRDTFKHNSEAAKRLLEGGR